MAFRKDDLHRLMGNLNIPRSAFDEEDYKLFEKGGISISEDSEAIDTESLKDTLTRSFSSIDVVDAKINMDNILVQRLNQERNKNTMEHQKNQYSMIIMNLEKRIIELEHEKNRVRLEKEQELQRTIQEHRQKYDQLVQESKKTTSMSQLHSKRNILNIVSDIVNGAIPEIEYARLRDVPDRELREEEAHLVHLWEMITPLKEDKANLQNEIGKLREEVRQLNEKYQTMIMELRHANELLGRKDDDVRRTSDNYETTIKMLQSELNKAHIDLESLRDKGTRFDELYRDYVTLEKEKLVLENKVSFFSGVSDVRHEAPKTENDLKAKYAIICTDKEYLAKENVKLHEQVSKLEDKIERLEADLEQTRKMSKDYITEMMSTKSTYNFSYEKRINDDLAELKEKQRQELETVKDNLKDIYERQIAFLKDNKDELELKLDKATADNREKTRAYDEVSNENRNLQRRVNIDLSELRVQLRIKTDELERAQNLYEEAATNVKTLRHENDMFREKNNILKGEYYKLEANLREDSAGIRAQLAVAKEQLANYEAIENEIDRTVATLGQINDGDSTGIFMNTLNGAPTASKRRIQQAIALGQRLNTKQKECEELQARLHDVERHREQLEQDLKLSKSLLNKTDQPYAYLIQNIEEKENEVNMLKEKFRSRDEESQCLRMEHEKLIQDYNALQQDLNKLMIKREHIKRIQQVLINLLQEDRENYSQNDIHNLVEQINAITESKFSQGGRQVTIGSNFYDHNNVNAESRFTQGGKQMTGGSNFFNQINAHADNRFSQSGGFAAGGGSNFYERKQVMETPTRDVQRGNQSESLKQSETGMAPQWFNKLKSSLRK